MQFSATIIILREDAGSNPIRSTTFKNQDKFCTYQINQPPPEDIALLKASHRHKTRLKIFLLVWHERDKHIKNMGLRLKFLKIFDHNRGWAKLFDVYNYSKFWIFYGAYNGNGFSSKFNLTIFHITLMFQWIF